MVAPLLIAGAVGGGMALGGLIGKAFDKDDPTKINPYQVNSDAYNYAAPEGYASSLGNKADDMYHRDAYNANWLMANQDYAMQQQAREQQLGVANMYQDYLSGKSGPSQAELQMRQGFATNANNAMAMANSTRGGNFLLANRMAQQQNAIAGQNLVGQTALLKAKEQDAARAALANIYGQVRSGDFQARAGSQAQTQADIQNEQFQRQLNQQGYLGMLGMQQHVYDQQTAGNQAAEAAKQNAYLGVATHNAQMNDAKNQRDAAFWGNMISAGAGIGAAGVGGAAQGYAQGQAQAAAPKPYTMGGPTGGKGGPWLCPIGTIIKQTLTL